MSKIASTEKLDGDKLRKCIDYFCHLSVDPSFYTSIKENDIQFAQTDYFQKMNWLKNEIDDLFDPTYTDVLRVAFASEFGRGRLAVEFRNINTVKHKLSEEKTCTIKVKVWDMTKQQVYGEATATAIIKRKQTIKGIKTLKGI